MHYAPCYSVSLYLRARVGDALFFWPLVLDFMKGIAGLCSGKLPLVY